MVQIVKAVHHCHSSKIVHRDIKIGNLYLDSNLEIKLGGFGLAVKLEELQNSSPFLCGTPNYTAPEVLAEQKYGPAVDIWALGVVLFTLLVGWPPFESNSVS